jgi:transcriptional regulator with XRE-family HTH domain
MDIRELLGRRIREIRKQRKLTQEELAERAGTDVKYLGGIERGTENPTIAMLEKLAHALSVKSYQIINTEHEIQGEKALRRRINQILEKCDQTELRIIFRLVLAVRD